MSLPDCDELSPSPPLHVCYYLIGGYKIIISTEGCDWWILNHHVL